MCTTADSKVKCMLAIKLGGMIEWPGYNIIHIKRMASTIRNLQQDGHYV